MQEPSLRQFAASIDHTLLRANASAADIRELCAQASQHQFKAVCVNLSWLPFVASLRSGQAWLACTVIGFPLGALPLELKLAEVKWALAQGANEVDVVINLGRYRSVGPESIHAELSEIVTLCHAGEPKVAVKAILETGFLQAAEITELAQTAARAGVDFVKTSSGYGPRGASCEDITLLKSSLSQEAKRPRIKASAGIRDLAFALALLHTGADRLGTSAACELMQALATKLALHHPEHK